MDGKFNRLPPEKQQERREELERLSVQGYKVLRQPFRLRSYCPSCGVGEMHRMTYKDIGEFHSMGEAPDPHLEVECIVCGFTWEMEVRHS